jgi:GNAT superfamily N-acetyltransferase
MDPGPGKGGIEISTDRARLDVDAIHAYLSRSYWAARIPRDVVARSLDHSLCFGVYDGGRQVGFARVITDRATYAYLADVYILASHRGRGLGVRLMEHVMAHPDLQGLRRWSLVTQDAQGLYRKFGFQPLAQPERHMEIARKGLY